METATSEREKTLQTAISALKNNPAYLTLFCLGLMGGPVIAGAFLNQEPWVVNVAIIAWIVFLIVSILVVAYVETHRIPASALTTSPFEPDSTRWRESFLDAPSAKNLEGNWDVFWYRGEGEDREAYEPDPKEIASFRVQDGPGVFVRSHDSSSQGDYWMFGRLSVDYYLPMIYWSQSDAGTLSGVALVKLDRGFEGKGRKMKGWWIGRTREGDDVITRGEVELNKKI